MTRFVLAVFRDVLDEINLIDAVAVVRYMVPRSPLNFFGVLEHYNLVTCSFFNSLGEIDHLLHVMQEVSGLSLGDFPYEEHVPIALVLALLEEWNPELIRIY